MREVMEMLSPKPGDTVVDCTAGLGGHAEAMARAVGRNGCIVLFDLDPGNLAAATERLARIGETAPRIVSIHASFHEAPRRVRMLGLRADVVLADLGFSSNQVDSPARGFAFSKDGPLDMRLDPTSPLTAAELVNTLSTRELARILSEFGEERAARRIVEKIARERAAQPITTTGRLAQIVREAVPHDYRTKSPIHPATKTFQALRIAVNDELGKLDSLLDGVVAAAKRLKNASARSCGFDGTGEGSSNLEDETGGWMKSGARVGVISFHSLEDRRVKQMFGRMSEKGVARLKTKKPVEAGEEEVKSNPRSRSAKLRVAVVGG